VADNGNMAVILSQGETKDDLAMILVFRVDNGKLLDQGMTRGLFDPTVGGIASNGDLSVIAAAACEPQEIGAKHAIQAFKLADQDGRNGGNNAEWVPLGKNVSQTSPKGQFSLSSSNVALVVGDGKFGEERNPQGPTRTFQFQDEDWQLETEFQGNVTQGEEQLGWSTSTDENGTAAAVGMPLSRNCFKISNAGGVAAHAKENGTWIQ